jgi:hypothetical protein
MSESPFNPVAPAFVNALRDAIGIRFTEAPFLRESTSTIAPTVPPGEGAGRLGRVVPRPGRNAAVVDGGGLISRDP